MTGIFFKYEGALSESKQTQRVQNIVAKHQNHFYGELVSAKDVETESDFEKRIEKHLIQLNLHIPVLNLPDIYQYRGIVNEVHFIAVKTVKISRHRFTWLILNMVFGLLLKRSIHEKIFSHFRCKKAQACLKRRLFTCIQLKYFPLRK